MLFLSWLFVSGLNPTPQHPSVMLWQDSDYDRWIQMEKQNPWVRYLIEHVIPHTARGAPACTLGSWQSWSFAHFGCLLKSPSNERMVPNSELISCLDLARFMAQSYADLPLMEVTFGQRKVRTTHTVATMMAHTTGLGYQCK